MIHLRDHWQQTLRIMPRLNGAFCPITHPETRADAVPLGAVPDYVLRQWMADATAQDAGADTKCAAAYLIGDLADAICHILAGLVLQDYWLFTADPGVIGMLPRFVRWERDGARGVSLCFDLCVPPKAMTFKAAADPHHFAHALSNIFAPVVEQLQQASGLGQAALYRLVGDSLAAACLAHGRAMRAEQEAMAIAMAILRHPGTKLHNRQVRFDHVALPEAPGIDAWFRIRGGCCRAYTRPGKHDYCTTCVLRDDDSRHAKLRDHLRRTRLGAA